jgi:hypothetical protein
VGVGVGFVGWAFGLFQLSGRRFDYLWLFFNTFTLWLFGFD